MVETVPPAMPVGLGQGERRIIAVICHWEVPEPDRTRDVEVQLLYGDMLLYYETHPPTRTERTFPVPMASSRYLLRVRAGNAGGWSEWAQAWVETQVYPLIDSRLGVLAATYQEAALYPDTWTGGMGSIPDGGAESESFGLSVGVRRAGALDVRSTQAVTPTLSVEPFRAWNPMRTAHLREAPLAVRAALAMEGFRAGDQKRDFEAGGEPAQLAADFALGAFNSAVVRFQAEDTDNQAVIDAAVTMTDFTTEAQ